MTDLHAIREQVREIRSRPAPVESVGGGNVSSAFWLVAIGAAVLGFAIVLFTPRIYSVQRTASLPTFQQTRDRIEAEAKSEVIPPTAIASNPSRYAGKSIDEMGKLADEMCFQRAHAAQRHHSKTPRLTNKDLSDFAGVDDIRHYNALMQCLVTEAPARYCSVSQSDMIKAQIAMYFRGVEYASATMKTVVAQHQAFRGKAGVETDPEIMKSAYQPVAPDEKVLVGIEGLMRAGYLTAAQRSDINAIAPRPIAERFSRVVANVTNCPKPPWWAVWR